MLFPSVFVFILIIFINLVIARSNVQENLREVAITAARELGCLPENVQVETKEIVISNCFAGGKIVRVFVIPSCVENCDTVERRTLAEMRFNCDAVPTQLQCLQ